MRITRNSDGTAAGPSDWFTGTVYMWRAAALVFGAVDLPFAAHSHGYSESSAMALRIGRHTFHFTTYDPPSDVLDAGVDGPPEGRRERSPENHVWRLDDKGRLVGITLMNPRRQL